MNKLSKDMIFKIFSYLSRYELCLLGKASKRLTLYFREYEKVSGHTYCLSYRDCHNPEYHHKQWGDPVHIGYCYHYNDMMEFIKKYSKEEIKESEYCEDYMKEGTKRYIDYTYANIISKTEPFLTSQFLIKYICGIPYEGAHFIKGVVNVHLLKEIK